MNEKKPLNIEIGKNVKCARERAGLTQERIGELLALGEKHISAIERGAVGVSLPTLKRLCSLLAVPADTILFGTPEDDGQDERAAALRFVTERLSRLPDRQFWAAKEMIDKLLEIMALNQNESHSSPE